jgi:hypothetical protein
MDNFAKPLVTKHKARFIQGKINVLEKREQWNDLVARTKSIFENIESEIKEQQFFRKLGMIDTLNNEMFQKLPYIQFSFTQQIVGYEKSNSKNCTEAGCTLRIVLLVDGSIVCVLYPFKSDLYSRSEEYLVTKIVELPNGLTESDIKKLFEQLFSYAQVSSVFGSPTWEDKIMIYQLTIRHYWYHFKIITFLSGRSKLLIYPFIRLIST